MQLQIWLNFVQKYTGNLKFNTKYLREHLIFCLEQGHFRPFLKLENSSKIIHNKPEIPSIVLSCECGNPDTIEDMIGCDWKSGHKTCSTWKHKSCANLDVGDLNWYCNKHIH